MRRFVLLTATLSTCLLLQSCCKILGLCTKPSSEQENWSHYGGEVDAHAVPEAAMGSLGDVASQIKVEGTITEVCAVKGCWMKMKTEDGQELLVRFKDYGFFVPRNAAGRDVLVVGTAQRSEMSVDALRHIAEDAGKSPAEVAAITKPATQVTFMADAVWVQGAGLQEPYRPIGQEKCDPVDAGTTPVKSSH